ncbi:hypothetical protein C8R42DRAFT_645549 [Lentinula raphanica]|nr:hypothetical protein C8R42DRAFT_645549 [Lentinula raphanica]
MDYGIVPSSSELCGLAVVLTFFGLFSSLETHQQAVMSPGLRVVVKALFLAILPQFLQPIHLFSLLSSSFCTPLEHNHCGLKFFHKAWYAIRNKYEASPPQVLCSKGASKHNRAGKDQYELAVNHAFQTTYNGQVCRGKWVLFRRIYRCYILSPDYCDLIVRVAGRAQVYREFMNKSKKLKTNFSRESPLYTRYYNGKKYSFTSCQMRAQELPPRPFEISLNNDEIELLREFKIDYTKPKKGRHHRFSVAASNLANWIELLKTIWQKLEERAQVIISLNSDVNQIKPNVFRLSAHVCLLYRLHPIWVYVISLPILELREAWAKTENNGYLQCFDVDKQDAATGSGNGLAYLRALQAVNKVTSWYSAAIFLTHHTGKLLGQKHLDVKWFSSLQTTGDFFVCSKEEAAAVLHAITSKKPEPRAVRALRYISRSAVIHTEAALMEYTHEEVDLDVQGSGGISTNCCHLCTSLQKNLVFPAKPSVYCVTD